MNYYMNLVNLGSLLNQLGIKVKDMGNRFLGRCPNPSHFDKSPSWNVYKDTGHHVCFSCGYDGSLNGLVKSLTGKNIFQYLEINNPESYIFTKSLDNKKRKYFPEIIQKKKINITEGSMSALTINLYSENKNAKLIIDYIIKKNLTTEFIKFFEITNTDSIKINNTFFTNRICIPIKENNNLISIEGRDFTGIQNKKVLYPKGSSVNTLFNIDNLDFNKPLIVVEGIMDLPLIWTYITKNVTCTFGNALTYRQLELLKKIKHLILCPDNDIAGYKMITQFDTVAEEEYEIVVLKDDRDPGALSVEELIQVIQDRVLAVDYFINKANIIENKKIIW